MVNGSFISIYENAVPDELCDRVIAKHKELEESSASTASRGENDNGGLAKRKDVAFYFERDARNIASEINAVLDQNIPKYVEEYPSFGTHHCYSNIVKVQRTGPKGGFHAWHCEQSMGENLSRILVWMMYLNDLPQGEGTTEFLEQGVIIQPKKGSLVLFPPAWTHTHRGNPVYTQDKYIATGWYYLA